MKQEYLSIETTKKLADYDNLKEKATYWRNESLAKDSIIKQKNKTIETLRNQVKQLQKEKDTLMSYDEQIKLRLD